MKSRFFEDSNKINVSKIQKSKIDGRQRRHGKSHQPGSTRPIKKKQPEKFVKMLDNSMSRNGINPETRGGCCGGEDNEGCNVI